MKDQAKSRVTRSFRRGLASIETDLNRGAHINSSAGSEPFGVYARRWLDERDLRARTRDTYDSQLNWILERFESVRLRDVTPAAVRTWYGELHKSHLAANTVAKVYRLFRTIMGTAVEDGNLRGNPVNIKRAAREETYEGLLPTYADVDPMVRFHSLRHLSSTPAASAGASIKELMARMGHATSDASVRYLNKSAQRDAETAAAMDVRITAERDVL